MTTENLRASKAAGSLPLPRAQAMEHENFRLLWKGDKSLHLYHEATQHGTRTAAAAVTLNSLKPLRIDQVKEAFYLLQKKCLNLRTCVKTICEDLWIAELPNADVDFMVLEEDADYMEVADAIIREGFPSDEVPHWRVRLIPRSIDTPCVLPEIKQKYPYQYDYVLVLNHAIADGMNYAMIIQFSLDILNALIEGETVDESQLGTFSHDDGVKDIERKIEDECNDPTYLSSVAKQFPSSTKQLWLNKVFPQPVLTTKPFTKHISKMIDTDVLSKMTEKSKKAGVTFNTSFVAVINTAIVDFLKESGTEQDSYEISTNHLVNIRRYLPKTKVPIFGSYAMPMSHSSLVPSSVKENFWDYAKLLHQDLNARLKSGAVFEQNVYQRIKQAEIWPCDLFKNLPPVNHDYGVSNLGDLTGLVPGTGKHVQVTDMIPYNYIHSFVHMLIHQLVTYRGHSRYTLSYDTKYFREEDVLKIVDKVFMYLVTEI